MGWAFLGSFLLHTEFHELLLLFSLFLSPVCFPSPEKTLWRFHSQLFSVSH